MVRLRWPIGAPAGSVVSEHRYVSKHGLQRRKVCVAAAALVSEGLIECHAVQLLGCVLANPAYPNVCNCLACQGAVLLSTNVRQVQRT